MPVTLTIKNLPDETAERLRKRAKDNHRSLQGELMAILEAVLEPRPLTAHEVRERSWAMGLRTEPDSVEIIRRDRDSR